EPRARPECLPHVHVLAARSGVAGGELGKAQRAQERERAAEHPGDEREPRTAQLGGDETASAEDPRPQHDADHHGKAVEQAQRSFEVRHGGRICTQKRRGAASRRAPQLVCVQPLRLPPSSAPAAPAAPAPPLTPPPPTARPPPAAPAATASSPPR